MPRRVRALVALACIVGILAAACGPASPPSWDEFHHANSRDGYNATEATLGPGAATRLVRKWTAAVGGAVDSSPAVSSSGFVVVGAPGNVRAYDKVTGTPVWNASTGSATPSSAAWSSNSVLVGASDGKLYAFDGNNGKSLWSATTGGALSSAAVAGSDVYVGSADGKVYDFAADTGKVRWSTQTFGQVRSSPAVGALAYAGTDDGNVYAFDLATGAIRWTRQTAARVRSTPAVSNGVVYVGSDDGNLYALDGNDGTVRWKLNIGGVVDSSPAVDGSTVYIASEAGTLRAVDASAGTSKWSASLDSGAYSSAAVANGVVYVGTRAGLVRAFNAVNGAALWSDTTGAAVLSSPAVQDSIVYVGSGDGTLYAYATADPCNPLINKVTCENSRPGTPQSVWGVPNHNGGSGIDGFATDISVNVGGTVHFKISTAAIAYHADIYRVGYYGGAGARFMATIHPSVALPQAQPACLTDTTTNLVDCGNWAESASWTVPPNAVSGVYFARLNRDDGTTGSFHIVFVVRDDASHTNILFQTSDPTWTAYNSYGGEGIYTIDPTNGRRAYKASYNRPLYPRYPPENQFFRVEYPMIRFLEGNGYDVAYASGIDSDRYGSHLLDHNIFMSVGHDEYWSAAQRANVESARAAGVHLAFFSGNEIYWKTRYEPSSDASGTPYRTLVVYKETLDNAKIDPSPTWTGLWRDHRFSPPSDGGRPENAVSGTSYISDPMSCCASYPITVSAEEGALRFWRGTSLATLGPGTSVTFGDRVVGYEFDADFDNGFRPPGEIDLSSTTIGSVPSVARPPGGPSPSDDAAVMGRSATSTATTAQAQTATVSAVHHLATYRMSNGTRVFSAGTIQWAFGLDGNADGFGTTPDTRIQQATVNVLADMGVQPATLQGGLIPATATSDITPPTSYITSPTASASFVAGSTITVTGTANDTDGRVGGIEVSTDGTTWHPATGRAQWTYSFAANQASGPLQIRSRATDDSGNIEAPTSGVTITIVPKPCPCTIFGSGQPTTPDSGDGNAIEVGMKFRPDTSGFISGIRFYKSSANTGPHLVNLWTSSGTLLASAPAVSETSSGWQQVDFALKVPVTTGTLYVASYHSGSGHVADDRWYSTLPAVFFQPTGVDATPLHMVDPLGPDGPSVFATGATSTFPTTSSQDENYWVDPVFTP